MGGATKRVVGIIGDDPLSSRVLGMLLEGAGYEVRIIRDISWPSNFSDPRTESV